MRSLAGIRDQVSGESRALALLKPLVKNISANQDLPPAQQVLVPAAVLVCLCDALQTDPHEVVNQIMRARKDMNSAFQNQWAAMVEYAKGEIQGGLK